MCLTLFTLLFHEWQGPSWRVRLLMTMAMKRIFLHQKRDAVHHWHCMTVDMHAVMACFNFLQAPPEPWNCWHELRLTKEDFFRFSVFLLHVVRQHRLCRTDLCQYHSGHIASYFESSQYSCQLVPPRRLIWISDCTTGGQWIIVLWYLKCWSHS